MVAQGVVKKKLIIDTLKKKNIIKYKTGPNLLASLEIIKSNISAS